MKKVYQVFYVVVICLAILLSGINCNALAKETMIRNGTNMEYFNEPTKIFYNAPEGLKEEDALKLVNGQESVSIGTTDSIFTKVSVFPIVKYTGYAKENFVKINFQNRTFEKKVVTKAFKGKVSWLRTIVMIWFPMLLILGTVVSSLGEERHPIRIIIFFFSIMLSAYPFVFNSGIPVDTRQLIFASVYGALVFMAARIIMKSFDPISILVALIMFFKAIDNMIFVGQTNNASVQIIFVIQYLIYLIFPSLIAMLVYKFIKNKKDNSIELAD